MGKQGHGIGKGKPKLKDRGFGNALIRQQQTGGKGLNGLFYYQDAEKKVTLMSNLESSDLNEYMDGIELEQKAIGVHRVKSDADAAFLVEGTTHNKTVQTLSTAQFDYTHLPVPRKPEWNKNMNAGEIDHNERHAFLNWRRKLAEMEEAQTGKFRVTPFEKNLEVWRQLWRVLEKSDFGVQIIDARNPLIYYTEDLFHYAKECDCPTMIVLNKADFLTEYQRKAWAHHFDRIGVQFAFYSAVNEQRKIDTEARLSQKMALSAEEAEELEKVRATMVNCDADLVEALAEDIAARWRAQQLPNADKTLASTSPDGTVGSDKAATKNSKSTEEKSASTMTVAETVTPSSLIATAAEIAPSIALEDRLAKLEESALLKHRCRVLTRLELILLLERVPALLAIEGQERHGGRVCVGLMGFPNVGKSSAINSMLGVSKSTHGVTRVAVSSTPGKTKHFQTLIVHDALMLCDCPGLVFPSFMRSVGEMLCAGILPINQMRTYLDPATVISSRVPQHLLEACYGMKIRRDLDIKDNPDRPPTGSEMLTAYCKVRGLIATGSGRWDEFRACKEIVRDFCDGVILFVAPPDQGEATAGKAIDYSRWLQDTEIVMQRSERVADRLIESRLKEAEEKQQELRAATAQRDAEAKTDMVFGGGKWEVSDAQQTSDVLSLTDRPTIPSVFAGAPVASTKLGGGGAGAGAGGAGGDQASFQFDDESSEDDENVAIAKGGVGNADEKTKREHKKVKHWGKKNKKLRDKNPYGEENGKVALVVQTTSRAKSGYSTTRVAPLK